MRGDFQYTWRWPARGGQHVGRGRGGGSGGSGLGTGAARVGPRRGRARRERVRVRVRVRRNAGSGTDSGRSVRGIGEGERWRRGGLLGQVGAGSEAIAEGARRVMIGLLLQHFVEHAQRALGGPARRRSRPASPWQPVAALSVTFASAFAAECGGVGQIQTGFDHARHEIRATPKKPRARFCHGSGSRRTISSRLDARQLGALHAEHARFQDQLLAVQPLRDRRAVTMWAGIIAVRRGAGSSRSGNPLASAAHRAKLCSHGKSRQSSGGNGLMWFVGALATSRERRSSLQETARTGKTACGSDVVGT